MTESSLQTNLQLGRQKRPQAKSHVERGVCHSIVVLERETIYMYAQSQGVAPDRSDEPGIGIGFSFCMSFGLDAALQANLVCVT